jgi:hypothetical protein
MGGRGQGFPVPVRPFFGWETPVPTCSFLSLPRQCIRKGLRFPRERIFCRGERRAACPVLQGHNGGYGQGFLWPLTRVGQTRNPCPYDRYALFGRFRANLLVSMGLPPASTSEPNYRFERKLVLPFQVADANLLPVVPQLAQSDGAHR